MIFGNHMLIHRLTYLILLVLTHATDGQERFSTSGKDWQIPHAQPKSLVWYEGWTQLPNLKPKQTAKQGETIAQLQLGDEAKVSNTKLQ